jgi:predicted DNA-binding transcriptional regulator AlpA
LQTIEQTVRELVRQELTRLLPPLSQSCDPDQLLSTAEVADLTTLSKPFFEIGRSQGNKGLPPYFKIGRRVLYRRGDVMAWLENRRRGHK